VADLFTLTSFSVETFSIAALEAMCYGIPISLTNIGGAAEMVVEGKNGNLSLSRNPTSMASSWASLLDAGLDKAAIREHTVNNYSIKMIFEKYRQAILTKSEKDL
jgi:glycosyltransferase involved in cell wall biosynthesis